jgi:outer membrane protein assembly factor BamB
MGRKFVVPTITLLFFVFPFSFLHPAEATSPGYRHVGADPARSGSVNSEGPKQARVIWEYRSAPPGKKTAKYVVIDEDVAFISLENGEVLALGLFDGGERWRAELNHELGGIAVTNNQVLVVSSSEPLLFSLNKETGELAWQQNLSGSVSHSMPLVVGDKVFVGDDSCHLAAFNTKSGKMLWGKSLSCKQIHSSPAYSHGLIYVGTEGNFDQQTREKYKSFLLALSPDNGQTVWQFPIERLGDAPGKEEFIHGTPAVSEGIVYFGGENDIFYALNAKTGKLLWKYDSGGWFTSAPAVDEKNVYIGSWNGIVYAFDKTDGEIVWKYDVLKDAAFEMGSLMGRPQRQGINSWPLVSKNALYLGTSNGYFYAFDKETGEVIWRQDYGGAWPALSKGVLVVATGESGQDSGKLVVALSDKDLKAKGPGLDDLTTTQKGALAAVIALSFLLLVYVLELSRLRNLS